MITLCNNAVKQLLERSHQHWISKMGLLNLYCIASLKSKTLVAKLFSVSANQNEKEYDLIIVGGGIVGTATARELSIRYPTLKLALVEKENKLAFHQSGHNSGVIHAGIYYKPGTLKAKLCVEGAKLAYQYCDEHKIPYKKCGKLIVAVEPDEVPRLEELYERGCQNGVEGLKFVAPDEIGKYEPNCVGVKAIWSPHTGIVDWAHVNESYGKDFVQNGGQIHYEFQVLNFELDKEKYPLRLTSKKKDVLRCRFVVTAAGLYSDRIARLTGGKPNPRIVPFRGEYLVLKKEKADLVRSNIYPVPDPRFPFLGVHFTPRIDGSVWLGPNAVLAFKREGYRKSDFNLIDTWNALSYSGLRALIWKYFGPGLNELYRSYNTRAQLDLLRKYIPSLKDSDIEPKTYKAGVRAQALDENGNLVDDFVFDSGIRELSSRVLHVRNAPSPAATSSLAIAKMIADEVDKKFLKSN